MIWLNDRWVPTSPKSSLILNDVKALLQLMVNKWFISPVNKNGKVLMKVLLYPEYFTQVVERGVAVYPKYFWSFKRKPNELFIPLKDILGQGESVLTLLRVKVYHRDMLP